MASTEADRAWVRAVQSEKYLKGRLKIAADHFNRDPMKGFQFLQVCLEAIPLSFKVSASGNLLQYP